MKASHERYVNLTLRIDLDTKLLICKYFIALRLNLSRNANKTNMKVWDATFAIRNVLIKTKNACIVILCFEINGLLHSCSCRTSFPASLHNFFSIIMVKNKNKKNQTLLIMSYSPSLKCTCTQAEYYCQISTKTYCYK